MKNKRFVGDILHEAEKIRKKLDFNSIDLQNLLYYQYLELVNKSKFALCVGQKATVPVQFKRAFSTLSEIEKAELYLKNLKIVS